MLNQVQVNHLFTQNKFLGKGFHSEQYFEEYFLKSQEI